MKRVGKPVFFIVAGVILLLTLASFLGLHATRNYVSTTYIKGAADIRWGIDIRGGVDVTFAPPEGIDATDEEMSAAESVIKLRLVNENITDYEVYTDYNKDRIIVRFPWKTDEVDFNPEQAVKELGATAELTFREGIIEDENGYPTAEMPGTVVLTGADVESATAALGGDSGNEPLVVLKLKQSGVEKFSEATERLAPSKGIISIWMDQTLISFPQVQSHITEDEATISGSFTVAEAKDLADKINAGALPFALTTESFNTISPTLGTGARDAMVIAAAAAFVAIAIFVISLYRLPGAVAVIALLGQVAGTIASLTGFFPIFPSFTLTLPGIAGIILAIGIGVDANIITAERIKEELRDGKTLDGAIDMGFKRAFTAIFDGNITVIFTAVILMGAFGPTNSLFSTLLSPLFSHFGTTTAGTVYSFGYTLMVGVILNFLMGVTASRLMLKSLSRFPAFRNVKLYGGKQV